MTDSNTRRDPLTCALWHLVVEERAWDDCDCDPAAHHRWNCHTTPVWAQTIRDLDTNPWTVVTSADASYTVLWMRTFCCYGCGNPLDEGVHGASEYGGCV